LSNIISIGAGKSERIGVGFNHTCGRRARATIVFPYKTAHRMVPSPVRVSGRPEFASDITIAPSCGIINGFCLRLPIFLSTLPESSISRTAKLTVALWVAWYNFVRVTAVGIFDSSRTPQLMGWWVAFSPNEQRFHAGSEPLTPT